MRRKVITDKSGEVVVLGYILEKDRDMEDMYDELAALFGDEEDF